MTRTLRARDAAMPGPTPRNPAVEGQGAPAPALLGAERPGEDRPAACVFALVTERRAFDALGPEWSSLFERSGRPQQVFQTFEWLRHWADHYLDKATRLAVVTGRVRGRLVLVWPLVSRRKLGLTLLLLMGEPASQYGDLIVEQGSASAGLIERALAFVTSLPADVVWLRRVRADAAIAPLLQSRALPTGAAQAPFIDFAGAPDVAAFEKRLPSKLRSGRRRHLRRLQDIGPVAFEQHGPGAAAREFARLAFVFKRQWAVRGGRIAPTVTDPRLEQFFAAAAAGGRPGPDLRVSVLRCAGEPVGIEISVACKGRLVGHMLAAKPGFEKPGAGAILANMVIDRAVEQGFGVYDLLPPADPYKLEWASGCVAVRDFVIVRTLPGRIFKWGWIDVGRGIGRSLAARLPPWLGRALHRRAATDRSTPDA
jgi:CelD/BcsL family acetyltransferase involved in cellulose biosynthesis